MGWNTRLGRPANLFGGEINYIGLKGALSFQMISRWGRVQKGVEG